MADKPAPAPPAPYAPPNVPTKAMVLFHSAWWKEMVSREGQFSKVAFVFSMTAMIMLFLWLFQSLLHGTRFTFAGLGPVGAWEWVVPPFDSTSALAVFLPVASLYFGKSNVHVGAQPKGRELEGDS